MMKTSMFTFLLVLYCLTGCSQDDTRDYHQPGKIPIDAGRWYQLNNTSTGLEALFNNRAYDRVNTGYGMILKNYDAYYPILPGEKITIDSIKMFDGEGADAEHPMTIYAILGDWKKLPIAVFTGSRYNEWVGPDPAKPGIYALGKPVADIRYLVINTWGNFPGELEFYGGYTPPTPVSKAVVKHVPLKNFFGINAFEWDFEKPTDPGNLDPARLAAIKNFTGVRHYMDWEKLEGVEGQYAFSPTYNGSWNYDTIYQWCKANKIEVLACLKTIPKWLEKTYPAADQNNENIPMRYGKDPSDPTSYKEQAKVAFQYAARYGNNKNIDRSLLTLKKDNQVRTGLGFISYIECDNERDKWWKGRKAYQTGREYAANLSAFYDGNKNTMGPGVGVKNADPLMKVVMAGLARPSTDYVRGMIDWSKEHRGLRPDGTIDYPWDIINYHFYANDASADPSKKQTTGVSPEEANTGKYADDFIQMAHQYAGDMPVWVTEAGYDINPGSIQKAPAAGNRTALETQAEWILRTSLLYARSGVHKVFYYELYDDNPGKNDRYATSGLMGENKTKRPAADFLYQANKLFGEYTFKETISKNPVADHYTFNSADMYMLVADDNNAAVYILDLGSAPYAYVYTPTAGAANMGFEKIKTIKGKAEITVSGTPIFVTTFECK